jgi:hypothetical protein
MKILDDCTLGHAVAKAGADVRAVETGKIQTLVTAGHYTKQNPPTLKWSPDKFTAYASWQTPKGFDQIELVCDTAEEANELLPVLANMLRARA